MIQWGNVLIDAKNDTRVNYPVSFTNAVFRIIGIDCKYFIRRVGSSGNYSDEYIGQISKDFSNSGFTINKETFLGYRKYITPSEHPLNYLVIGK